MPNSAWTETGSSISLAPSATPISTSSSPEDVDHLTNGDKIRLMEQYTAELATKTSLDETAASLGIPSTNYDDAVAGINTTLIAAGAPADWATIWPDGTTFGPATGIQTSLSGDWSGIATARASLQTSISETQADAAKALAKALTMAASASIVPNGTFASGDETGWVVTDGAQSVGTYGALPDGSNGVTFPGGGVSAGISSTAFPVIPGQKYKIVFSAYAGSGTQNVYFRIMSKATQAANITSANFDVLLDFVSGLSIGTSPRNYGYDWTPEAGQNFASIAVYEWAAGAAPLYITGVYCFPYTEETFVEAAAITADMITTGTLNGANVDVVNIDASNITTGTISAAKVLFPDGTDMTTAARVSTSEASIPPWQPSSGDWTSDGTTNTQPITGLGWTTQAAGAGDTYNITAIIYLNPDATLHLFVDGNTSTDYIQGMEGTAITVSGTAYWPHIVLATITGLSAGSHTIQFYVTPPANPTPPPNGLSVKVGQNWARCQRIY